MDLQNAGTQGIDTAQGSQGAQSAPPDSVTSGAASSAPVSPASSGSTQAGAAGSAVAAATPGSGAPDYATVRETLANYGLGQVAGQFQDDHSLLQHLAAAYRERGQLAQLAQHGQTYLQHADQFQRYLAQQQEEARRQQAQANQWWKAPEYDPSWASKLTRDPATGEIRALPGADPSVVQKYLAWQEHQRSFTEKFAQDPIKAIQPGLEQLIDQRAQQLIQQQMGAYQQQTQAQQLVSNHSAWIFERDQQGNPLRDQTGQPVLNQWGQRYAHYVQQAERSGLRSVQAQDQFALGLVQRDYLAARFQAQSGTQQAQAQGDQLRQDFLARAQQGAGGIHQPNTGANGAAGPNGAAVNPPPNSSARGLASRMLDAFRANGFQPGQELQLGR